MVQDSNGAGKGDQRRPSQIGREEEDLRWALASGHITFCQFEKRYNQLLKEGKIIRSGRTLKGP